MVLMWYESVGIQGIRGFLIIMKYLYPWEAIGKGEAGIPIQKI